MKTMSGPFIKHGGWRLALCVSLALLFTLPLAAQQGMLVIHLGQLRKLAIKDQEVDLGGNLLHSAAARLQQRGAQQPLQKLRRVHVVDLRFAKPVDYSALLKSITEQLSSSNWRVIVRSREAGDRAWIAEQVKNGQVTAMAIVDAKPTKLSVINIVGPMADGLASLGSIISNSVAMGLSQAAVSQATGAQKQAAQRQAQLARRHAAEMRARAQQMAAQQRAAAQKQRAAAQKLAAQQRKQQP